MKKWLSSFWKDEEGLGTLEIILIIAVLVGVALIFRNYITNWVETLLNKSNDEMKEFSPADIGNVKPGE